MPRLAIFANNKLHFFNLCNQVLDVSELKVGVAFLHNGQKLIVLKQGFVKQGRATGIYVLKVRNLLTNGINEYSFKSGEVFEEVNIEKKKAQFLYHDGSKYIFMDNENFEQHEFAAEIIGDQKKFLLEGHDYYLMYLDSVPRAPILPPKIDLKVTQAEPGAKGDTASNPQKEITVETGYTLKAPLFVKEGDRIRINTETGEYCERAT